MDWDPITDAQDQEEAPPPPQPAAAASAFEFDLGGALARLGGPEPVEVAPADAAESNPVESNPVESNPVESNPAESNPAESNPAESNPVESAQARSDAATERVAPSGPAETSVPSARAPEVGAADLGNRGADAGDTGAPTAGAPTPSPLPGDELPQRVRPHVAAEPASPGPPTRSLDGSSSARPVDAHEALPRRSPPSAPGTRSDDLPRRAPTTPAPETRSDELPRRTPPSAAPDTPVARAPEPLPRRTPTTSAQGPTPHAATRSADASPEPADAPLADLPRRRPASRHTGDSNQSSPTPVSTPTTSQPTTAARRSAPAAQPEPEPVRARVANRSAHDSATRSARPSVFENGNSAPRLPDAGPGFAPSLPDVAPAPPPAAPGSPQVPHGVPPGAPPTATMAYAGADPNELRALRSAQLRAKKQQRGSHLVLRSILAVFLLAGVVGAALYVGQDYLFTSTWDAELVAVVDQIQTDRGTEFAQAVPLAPLPAESYPGAATEALYGTQWSSRLPEWRALGLVDGAATTDSVAAAIAVRRPVVFDPTTGRLLYAAGTDLSAHASDVRLELERAFAHQAATGTDVPTLTMSPGPAPGVLAAEPTAQRAIDRMLADQIPADQTATGQTATGQTATGQAATDQPGAGQAATDQPGAGQAIIDAAEAAVAPAEPAASAEPVAAPAPLPLPFEYQLAAEEELGAALVSAGELDPATLTIGAPLPAGVAEALSPSAARAADALVLPEEQVLVTAGPLGAEAWRVIWGARLPAGTVDQLAVAMTADSYVAFDRAGTVCTRSVFEVVDAAIFSTLLSGWVSAAPPEAGASALQLGATRVQLDACDPGAAAGAPNIGAASAVVTRQVDRLSR